MVDTGAGKEPAAADPRSRPLRQEVRKEDHDRGVSASSGDSSRPHPEAGSRHHSRGCVGPFWGVTPVPRPDALQGVVPGIRSTSGPAGFAALSKSAAVPFVVTKASDGRCGLPAERGDLFPRPPVREDIRQGELADCGLLAILDGIVTREPWFIPADAARRRGAGTWLCGSSTSP